MKINVFIIVKDHLRTLVTYPSNRTSKIDLLLFYVLPLTASFFLYMCGFTVKVEFYNVSITFFGIFIALLLNIQVAIFSIFLRKWDSPSQGPSNAAISRIAQRKALLSEINCNVSYLILVSCTALACFLVAYTICMTDGLMPCISALIYIHFLLTLLMVVKRTHAVFLQEYK